MVHRPCHHAKAVWGKKVWKISGNEFEMNHETYKSGLILKHLPPMSVTVSNPAWDISPFLSAPFILDLPFYVAQRIAQQTRSNAHLLVRFFFFFFLINLYSGFTGPRPRPV